MRKILAILVTYNRKDLLNECISALLNSSEKCDIMVFDNNSTDGTADIVNKYISNDSDTKIIYIKNQENIGGAGGYNKSIREACRYDYKYFWLMDDDCIVKEDSLECLLKADIVLQGRWGFLSSKVLWKDGSICKTNVQRKKVARKIKNFTSSLVNVDYASFVSLLIKKSDALKIGLPIKDFFIWSDDLEYTRRLTMNIDKGYLVNKSIVTHKCKENIGVDISKDSEDRLDRYKYIYRNDVYVFKREGIVGILYIMFRYIYHTFKILLSRDCVVKKIEIMTKSNIDGFSFFPNIETI